MLLWHKHDVERSLADLANFTPFPDEWTVEDKVLFEQAFSFHGKSFHRIQQMVRDWERHTCTYHPKYLKRVMKSKFSFFVFVASRQADLQPGKVLLQLEEDQNQDISHGPTGQEADQQERERWQVWDAFTNRGETTAHLRSDIWRTFLLNDTQWARHPGKLGSWI